MKKRCSTCKTELDLSCFYRNRSKSDGFATECKTCDRERLKKRYAENIDSERQKRKENYQENSDKYKERARIWERENRTRKLELRAKYREQNKEKISEFSRIDWKKHNSKRLAKKKEYRIKFPEIAAAQVRKRQAAKLNAMPKWADMEAIRGFYALARKITKETGVVYHVDHIYPLRSKYVCGLHNEFNLRVIPASVNQSKGNRILDFL